MKQQKYSISSLLLTAALTIVPAMSAWATTEIDVSRTPITNINLTIDSSIQAGDSSGDITATTADSTYYIDDVSIVNSDDNWIGGMIPSAEITLNISGNYYFANNGSSMFSFTGVPVTYEQSVVLYDSETLVLTISLDPLANGDLSTTGLAWDTENGIASWAHNPRAQYYQIRLYKDGVTQTDIFTTFEESYYLAPYMDEEGSYYFIVSAIGAFSEYGALATSDLLYVSESTAEIFDGASTQIISTGTIQLGHWIEDEIGLLYINTDGTYACNEWVIIDGYYYYFDEEGYALSGLIYWNDSWYYCGEDGALCSYTYTPDGRYVGSDGIVVE